LIPEREEPGAGGGLGTLVLLQKWAKDNDIRFKLFNPNAN
jgi:hypothetical protein